MNRSLSLVTAGFLLLATGSPVAARSHRKDAAETPAPPALQLPNSGPVAQLEPAPTGAVAPAPNPLWTVPPPPPPPVVLIPATRTRKYWELSAVGGAVLGGLYVASVLAGSLSYAGFYNGQWGWFVPLVGPMLTMGGAGGTLCSCFTNQLYTYGIGTILSLATIGALVPVVLGGVLSKTVTVGPSQMQVAPTVTPDSTGLVIQGRF